VTSAIASIPTPTTGDLVVALYYDRDGNPMEHEEWMVAFGFGNGIDKTAIGDVMVSTVWLGIDHSFGHGPPLIFETMVFGGGLDEYLWRWSTVAEAQEGHNRVVQMVSEGLPVEWVSGVR
jgi:hypothetical protein